MKISSKVIILVLVLLALTAVNGLVGQRMVKRMGKELTAVVNRDVVLMQTATAVTRFQLQKAVIFERVRRISEELAYQDLNAARKEHLLFFTRLARSNFDELAKGGALNIVNAKLLLNEAVRNAPNQTRNELQAVADVLKEIEKAHIHYDALVSDIFNSIQNGKYEISMEDLGQIHRDEKKLTTELQNLIDSVQAFTRQSLENSKEYEHTAEKILWACLILSLLLGGVLAISIIRSVTGPLLALEDASVRIGAGDLDVRLDERHRNEFGKVSRAFNEMSRQLKESKQKLEAQSETLRRNLELTDQQKKDLEKVNRELDRFVHTVSHDIRSPLMGIAWYADYLKKQYYEQLDEKGRDSLDGVCRGVERANALIKDLLALTRITRIRNPYQFVNIGAMVDEVIGNLDYKIKQSRVDVKVHQNLPTIICDAIKMKEVVLNLMSNAVKFSSGDGNQQPQVEVGHIDHVDAYEFYVKDNGIGIDPKHHDEIFGMFKRLDTSNKYEGTGAGLSIVKSIIEDHGGKVWVVSQLGQGAEFHFTIPKGLEVHRNIAEA